MREETSAKDVTSKDVAAAGQSLRKGLRRKEAGQVEGPA
jgi:hypothetical protein